MRWVGVGSSRAILQFFFFLLLRSRVPFLADDDQFESSAKTLSGSFRRTAKKCGTGGAHWFTYGRTICAVMGLNFFSLLDGYNEHMKQVLKGWGETGSHTDFLQKSQPAGALVRICCASLLTCHTVI